MNHTAWTQNASSLPSDRIPPSRPKQNSVKEKRKPAAQEPLKSKEVRRLEFVRDSLRKGTGRERDPKGGCFCQARVHTLSSYTPLCHNCGLVLCKLQLPHHACPHCASPLLTPTARDALVGRLEKQIIETVAEEKAARDRAIQDARAAAGAFPSLSATTSVSSTDALAAHPTNQPHKVLSLNAKTKKVIVRSSYTTPAISRSSSRDSGIKEGEEEQKRILPPPDEVVYARNDPNRDRPWANLRGGSFTYVPPPHARAGSAPSSSDKKLHGDGSTVQMAKKEGKRKDQENKLHRSS
ncbi:uncharacterized protein FIBRA_03729 [Fibroporia radiculosa]|uniref:TRIP4/RQT4 C2HC5-type zinc finger domain-containing protein n=1 Tax=Fibroporia radiculosa TaxID=599839 RepID=J4I9S4_9APHY|nr:uncharacterized protein FIBRA_03729 [Fibroporia radiculosa]CCM01666.1 predicted protein [Fibroporia radiculosa]